MHRNVSDWERIASIAGGAALVYLGTRQRRHPLATSTGLGLIARGVGGYCPINTALGRDSGRSNTKVALSGSRGVHVYESIVINRPPAELFQFWRDFANLPRFMEHLEDVRVTDRFHSHWVARGPLGVMVDWDAEIINDIPPTLLSWKSIGQSDVVSAGSVRFKPSGEHATHVQVKLQYDPPAGKLGATVAWLFGDDPQHQIAEDLRRFKQLLETGEITTGAYRATQSSQRMRRGLDASDTAGDFGSLR